MKFFLSFMIAFLLSSTTPIQLNAQAITLRLTAYVPPGITVLDDGTVTSNSPDLSVSVSMDRTMITVTAP